MPPRRPSPPMERQQVSITSILAGPRQIRRQSRDAVKAVVEQLFTTVAQSPVDSAAVSGISPQEYRIDDLARAAGTTTRNIRVYRDRGLLPAPARVGRLAIYNESHVARLRLITSMLDRGYNLAHLQEMLTAWEEGKDLGDILGIETALVGTWADERPRTVSRAEAEQLVDDPAARDRLVALGLIRVTGDSAVITRPKLIEAFDDIRQYGMGLDQQIDVYEKILPHIEEISRILVESGAHMVTARLESGGKQLDDAQIRELLTLLVKLRTYSVSSVRDTLAVSIESTIESMFSDLLAALVAPASTSDTA
ncbi:MerR family transcriptional regulator [Mycobacteroides franklinii]|uniref:MerR family transcriptional regulator n=1 Tax=Mycobacteroides franklinii TaxID=948102 RepID=A0A4R5P7V4_9MYCO|nr:MerR family transcriptional regulator [Mycobacteroides franklinii]ORA61671.1 MerR family transcriptional regulator [Mycobacteroides franklinii]TDH19167.1 MerR family transcriptional regulator [Mycobacteroides franklinii]